MSTPIAITLFEEAALVVIVPADEPAFQVIVTEAPAGDNGASAYTIAVENGFEGTEAEWLESLQGEPGEPGANPEIVVLTLAEYMALAPEVQTDGRWYVIPTA